MTTENANGSMNPNPPFLFPLMPFSVDRLLTNSYIPSYNVDYNIEVHVYLASFVYLTQQEEGLLISGCSLFCFFPKRKSSKANNDCDQEL